MTPPGEAQSTAVAAPLGAPAVVRDETQGRARRRGRVRNTVALLGPAFVAAVAYIDPGNFATNIAGGAKYGFLLLWVIVAANLMAMLVQYLSAKVGIATGRNLCELCRQRFRRPVTMPTLADRYWTSIAMRFAEIRTQTSRKPYFAPPATLVAKLPGST